MIAFLAWCDRNGRWIVLLALAMAGALWLSACGIRNWPQVAADLRAHAQAMGKTTDAAARQRLAEHIGTQVLALTDQAPSLPAPTWTAEQLAADPSIADAAVASSAAQPPAWEPPAPPTPPEPTPAEIIRRLGNSVLRWGGLAAACGAALLVVGFASRYIPLGWIASFVTSPLVSPLVRLAASLGSASIAIGAAMSWLADWLWLVVLVILSALAAVAWFHRAGLRKAWARLGSRAAP